MKKHIIGLSLLIFVCISVSAQTTDKTVEKIRTFYNDIAGKAKLAETDEDHAHFDELFMNELVINKLSHEWRAVGRHVNTYKFFYRMTDGDREDRMYPDELVMVKVERQESNRTYNEEYLYSRTGLLMFYFQKAENDDETPVERRVYFSGIKAIRVVEDAKTRDRLSAKDAGVVREITVESARIKDVFVRTLKFY
jgi:hypothetical protein